jgi:hypothetical protein
MVHRKIMMVFATAVFLAFAAAQAHAGGGATCKSSKGVKMHTGSDGSHCLASSDGTGKAQAKATGDSSSQTFVTTGGKSKSVATDHAVSEAESESGGKSTAHASNPGSNAFVDADSKGVATTTATGGSSGEATALNGPCTATSMATNGSTANADCENGGFVNSTATNGGEAIGSDTFPPECTPNGGTAKVRSTAGNCG